MAKPALNRIHSPIEALTAVRGSLRSISALSSAYDTGHYDAARDIATIIHRMITDELVQTKTRRELHFKSFISQVNSKNLLAQDLASLVDVRFKSDDGDTSITVTHRPMLKELVNTAGDRAEIAFKDWWNAPLWIAGASQGMFIPIDQSKHVPFHKRDKLSRMEVVANFRNKTGAHYDRDVDARAQWIEDKFLRSIDIGINIGESSSATHKRRKFLCLRTPVARPLYAISRLRSRNQKNFGLLQQTDPTNKLEKQANVGWKSAAHSANFT